MHSTTESYILTRAQMVIWGVISAATAAAHSFAGLLVARFFLGFVEATYFVCSQRSTPIKTAKLTVGSRDASTISAAGTLARNLVSERPTFTQALSSPAHSRA